MPQVVPTHRTPGTGIQARRRQYDRHSRDRQAKAFYGSVAWEKLRRIKLAIDPACENCLSRNDLVAASTVHHVVEIRDDWSRRFDLDNLRSVCAQCHARIHHAGGACK